MRARLCVAAVLAAASFLLQAHNEDQFEIVTLSNRADLVSGGDALIEVRLPKGTSRSRVTLKLNGVNVTPGFQTVAGGGALRGLVTGLVQGRNDFIAEIDGRGHGNDRKEHLVITNHPIGGPVLSGPQIVPYFCATPLPQAAFLDPAVAPLAPATNASGLTTAALDAQCNIATEHKLYYRTNIVSTPPCSFAIPDPSPGVNFLSTNRTDQRESTGQPVLQGVQPERSRRRRTSRRRPPMQALPCRLHRARRARHDEPRHLRHRGAVRPDQAMDLGRGAASAMERQDALPVRRVDRPAAAAGEHHLELDQRSGAVPRLSGGAEQHERLAPQFQPRVDGRDGDDDEGAYRRPLRPDQVHHGQRLLGRLDQLQHERLDHAGQPRRHHDLVRLSRFGDHRHRSRRLHVARRGVQQAAWTALQAGLTQAQINTKKAAVNGHPDQTGCHGWYNAFGSNGKVGNYVQRGVQNSPPA